MFYKIKFMTGYHDYLVVLSPPEDVIKKIERLKEFSFKKIGEYDSHYSKAHITVQYWPRKKPVWIEPMIPKLERDLQHLSPVILDINGFGFFDHAERPTIYAKLTSTILTEIWFKQLRKYFNTPDFVPHMTIAKGIPNADFKQLWPYFKPNEWVEQIKIDRLTILRRESFGYNHGYRIYKEIAFNRRFNFHAFANSKLKAPSLALNKVNAQQFSLF